MFKKAFNTTKKERAILFFGILICTLGAVLALGGERNVSATGEQTSAQPNTSINADSASSAQSNTNEVTATQKPVTVGTTTAGTGTVLNSHSNIDPEDSFAYVVADHGHAEAIRNVSTTPQNQSEKQDVIVQPSNLTLSESEQWLNSAKSAAIVDYLKTGRTQKIISLAATVATIQIGNGSIPPVSAVDVSSYQSWMTQTQYNRLAQLGVKGVTVKVTESTNYTNPYATSQVKMAKAAGLTVSTYHFAHFNSQATARAEADHTVAVMNGLGLPKTTLTFADMEASGTINNPGVRGNLSAYYNELSAKGYTRHGLYTSIGYSSLSKMQQVIGKSSTWIAQYPYTPSKSNMAHSDYGAWQFSSTAQIPGSNNYIDASHDYQNLLTTSTAKSNASSKPLNQPISFNKYVTVTSTVSGNVWNNFSWSPKTSVASIYHKTFLAKVVYYNSNGQTYYSLYTADGKFYGYINAGYVSVGAGPQGAAVSANKYVTLTSKAPGSIWNNFSWQAKSTVASHLYHTYHVKVIYYHSSGQVYYSLYDNNNQWVGYVNAGYCTDNGQQGVGESFGKYVTVTSTVPGSIWNNFSWSKKASVASVYHKTFLAKDIYYNASGQVYYSLYTSDNKFFGYVNAGYVSVGAGPQGAIVNVNKYATLTSKVPGSIWHNFYWQKQSSVSSHLYQTYHVKVTYYHSNGQTYYSLYDNKDRWVGYVNAGYCTVNGQQGVAMPYGKYVTITSTVPGSIWTNFSWHKKTSVASRYHKTYYAKWVYDHFSGQKYYSLYSNNGQWYGYINTGYTQTGAAAQGVAVKTNKKVKITSHVPGSIWSSFKWQKKCSVQSKLGQTFQVKYTYFHASGQAYYSLYKGNTWIGYINVGYTTVVK